MRVYDKNDTESFSQNYSMNIGIKNTFYYIFKAKLFLYLLKHKNNGNLHFWIENKKIGV